ncbi:AraC family transcriptional regulator [[Actinomadura] parvosata]|uniref:AraC family transcriptional regulator n=1 Tax=[Actinomadura] parvosata TaxID=1955412 RepID=UPI00406C54F6
MDTQRAGGADPLADLLNGVRTTGAVFNQSAFSGSWAVRFEDGSALAVAVPVSGAAWIVPEQQQPVLLTEGDVAVLSGGAPYTIASSSEAKVNVVIGPGGHCTATGEAPAAVPRPGEETVLMNGLYSVAGGAPGRLLAALPPLAVIRAAARACPVGPAALEQITSTQPGQQALLDRTLDLMLITALRAWFTRPGAPVPTWYRAHSDPVISRALHLLHHDLAYPWTVQTLAAQTGLSRAALAKRFTDLVGQPPMTYLREQRLTHAAELLTDPGTTLAAIARQVGFSSPFALSIAFKKAYGTSPADHRARKLKSP